MAELRKMASPLIVLAVLLVSSLLTQSAIINTSFVSHFGPAYNTDVRFNMSPANFTVVLASNGTAVTNGTLVCLGVPLNLSASNYSNFTPSNTVLECAFATCNLDSALVPSAFPQPVAWMSPPDFASNITFYSNRASWCRDYGGLPQPANPLAPYAISATYRTALSVQGTGGAYIGLFCHGNLSFMDGSTVIGSTFNSTTVGARNLTANLSTTECAVLLRSYDGVFNNVLDCIYSNAAMNNRGVTESMTIIHTNGPNFSVTSAPGSFLAAPGGSITINIPLQNTGEMNATITNITMDSGFTVTAFSPSAINAGQATTLVITATAPGGLGTYTPTVTLTYVSNTIAIGACGNGTQALTIPGNVTGGTIIIIVTPLTPISPLVHVDPSGVLSDGGQWYPSNQVLIAANITRSGSVGLYVSTTSNLTIYRLDSIGQNQAPVIARFCSSPQESVCSPLSVNSHYTTDTHILDYESIFLPFDIRLLSPGVYRAALSVYDSANVDADQKTKTASAYFTIYTLTCAEKG